MNCIFCGKEMKNKGVSHQNFCKENPNRKILDRSGEKNPRYGKKGEGKNQYTKAKEKGEIYAVSLETREKMGAASKGTKFSETRLLHHSEIMRKTAKENPDSYSGLNINGRVKKILYKNVKLDGGWELLFAKWCDSQCVKWEKPKIGFEYYWEGKTRTYYPDFYLVDFNLFIEIKGYERKRDLAKWKSVHNLKVIKNKEIQKIREGDFSINLLID